MSGGQSMAEYVHRDLADVADEVCNSCHTIMN
jgi:hypothetical protein